MTPALSPRDQQILVALQQAVSTELERKRRLGQYVVTWQDGKALMQGPDAPQPPAAG
ncbi:hypothetical protein [Cyanobium sp. NS01]|uniref:hypothetical protein n=1 Tax=Cyanobium sp. NS01 TaxID=261284 RepID=UPI00164867A6|nr:hypothetical protein [Cyanobium sp. NS01]